MRSSKGVAALATFVASGLLHEYILLLLAMKESTSSVQYFPRFGAHVAFFLWNGVVLCLEHLLSGAKEVEWLSNVLPRPIKTGLVLLAVLPVGHWFTDEYVANGMLPDFALAFPQIVRLT